MADLFDHRAKPLRSVEVIDSHTEGEPTRVVVAGAPALRGRTAGEKLEELRAHHDGFRASVVLEPRGSEVIVGALLLEPEQADSTAGVIFFNDVGYLGMCGHGTIGLVTTLAYLGRIAPGVHRIETPVGVVTTCLHADGRVSVENVPSYRYRAGVTVEVPGIGVVRGDIAWGGNWFFIADIMPAMLNGEAEPGIAMRGRHALIAAATATRAALAEAGITGADGSPIDHIEFQSAASDPQNSGRNFVLCPGASFDRSPCGTGTSAKMACLAAAGKLAPGETWRQEGILGTVFEGSIQLADESPCECGVKVVPTITGRAWVTAESKLLFDATDPFVGGIPFP
jgi:4-hydroxyproline epimerase